jgi:hypothetical protein
MGREEEGPAKNERYTQIIALNPRRLVIDFMIVYAASGRQ